MSNFAASIIQNIQKRDTFNSRNKSFSDNRHLNKTLPSGNFNDEIEL